MKITKIRMNNFISNKFENKATELKYARISVNIKWFSSVLGRTLIFGDVRYISKNNFRTNKDLNKYMDSYSPKNKTVFIILKHARNFIERDFKNLNFFPKKGHESIYNSDYIFYAENVPKIKFKRNKQINIKVKRSRLNDIIYENSLLNVHLNLK